MNGAFQGSSMQNMAYSGMIGQGRPGMYGGMPMGEAITGGVMNRASAMGGPLAMGAMGIMGMDPMSRAMGAGWDAFKGGAGLGRIGANALGAAALPMAGIMAAGYAGSQMMTGAQQQQNLNAGLRSSFQFMNPMAAGGRGFSSADMGAIGGNLRQMAGQVGPGGEIAGFEELSRLASNMGRMGMSQGVRSAKDFSDRFKQMVGSLKEIATAFQTNLEEAQQMMSSMRGAGIFGAGKAAQFAKAARAGAVAGGLATTEVTGMMSIGSQIARSIGGRGVAGARAGIETITNLGVAQQLGILNEEDVYNATGLTGAEGRQALATQQLQESGNFLKTSRGRYFLASLAGKNGQLDERSVREVMAGGVGTNQTRQMAQRNLQGVGRANFIRNEGRLRGEVLAQFGGNAMTMAYTGWLQERGFDVTNLNDDRAALALQRFSGMGRDEAEAAVKEVRDLPRIMREKSRVGEEEQLVRRLEFRRAHTGVEGVKRKLEEFKNEVQNNLQSAGQDLFNAGSEMVTRLINKVTDTYIQKTQADVGRAAAEMRRGGTIGGGTAARVFGVGGGRPDVQAQAMAGKLFGAGAGNYAEFKETDLAAFQRAGFNVQGAVEPKPIFAGRTRWGGTVEQQRALRSSDQERDARLATALGGIQRISAAVQEADRPELLALGAKNADWLRDLAASGKLGTAGGTQRLEAFERAVKGAGAPAELQRAMEAAKTPEDRARLLVQATGGAMGREAREAEAGLFAAPDRMSIFGQRKFGTEQQRHEAIAEFVFGKRAFGARTEGKGVETAMGAFMDTESFRDLAAGMLDDKTRVGTRQNVVDRMAAIRRKEIALKRDGQPLTEQDRGELGGLQRLQYSADYQDLKRKATSTPGFDFEGELKALAARHGFTDVANFERQANAPNAILSNAQDEAIRQYAESRGPAARKEVERMISSGVMIQGEVGKPLKLGADLSASLGKIGIRDKKLGTTAAQRFIGAMAEATTAEAAMTGITDPEKLRQLTVTSMAARARARGETMSFAEMQQTGRVATEAGMMETGQELSETARYGKAIQTKGLAGIAGALGVQFGQQELRGLSKMTAAQKASALAQRMGVTEEQMKGAGGADFMKTLETAASGIGAKGTTKQIEAAHALRQAATGDFMQNVQKANNLAQAERDNPLQKDANATLKEISGSLSKNGSNFEWLKALGPIQGELINLNAKLAAKPEAK